MLRNIFLITVCIILMVPGLFAQDIPVFPKAETIENKVDKQKDNEKLAAEYLKNKDFDKALVLYEKLFDEKGTHFYYTYYLYCLIELQDYKTALKVIRKQYKQDTKQLRYLVDEGFIYTLSGEQDKARKTFDEALQSIEPNANQVRDLANAYNYRGQTDYAIRTYETGRKMIPDNPFNLELAQIYNQLGNNQEMVKEYLDLIDFDLSKMEMVQGRLQSTLDDDPEGEKNEVLRTELLRRVQRFPDKTYFAEMLIWHSIQQKDFSLALVQAKSLDRRFQENGARIYDLAQLCMSNDAYEEAIEAFNYLLAKGTLSEFYLNARIGLLNARYLKVTNRFDYTRKDLDELENEYQKALNEFGETASTVPIMRYLARLQAFYLDKIDTSIELLNKAIEIPAVPAAMKAECKMELADILLFSGNVWDATLLYSQVDYDFKNDPLGHQAKYKNAKLSYYIGEFGWAKAQLDILKAATSKLISNDAMDLSLLIGDNIDMDSSYTALSYYAKADLLSYRKKLDLALVTLDSVQMVSLWHPLHDEVLFKKAEIMVKKGEYKQADSLYAKVTEMYPDDILADNALFERAELYQYQFNDTKFAMELYEKLMLNYTGSLFVVDARKRYRELRGDILN